jgi:transcriptional regulator with XRE-family HTH domain
MVYSAPNISDPDEMAEKLKRARRLNKKTLKEVATQAGCSESMISKIERGRVTPSLKLLTKLTDVLGITVASLFRDEADLTVFTYQDGERPVVKLGSARHPGGVTYLERLIPSAEGRLLNAGLHVVPPGGGSDGALSHPGDEVGFVISGFIELTVDGRTFLIGAGSSFFFSSTLPHSYRNIGTETARIVWVNSPTS